MHRPLPRRLTRPLLAALFVALGASSLGLVTRPAVPAMAATASRLPDRLADGAFWQLVTELSEPPGDFHSDNFTSNESGVSEMASRLAVAPRGGAYLGVGPEQNFTYIAATRPSIAFILDIRRRAVVQHLLYKALFELSGDRADFVARLFSRERPRGIPKDASAGTIWKALATTRDDDAARLAQNVAEVWTFLTSTRGFELGAADRDDLEYVYRAFHTLGPRINYAGFQDGLSTGRMSFEKLSLTTDRDGMPRSFLASDESFQFVRRMHLRNLIVPVVGDFAGPTALRAIGRYLDEHEATVSVFYLSNVEQYLFGQSASRHGDVNGGWRAFYENVRGLPTTPASLFLRVPSSLSPSATDLCPIEAFLGGVDVGRVSTYQDARRCAR